MNFTPEVIAALETLRKNAVNDFELHRIGVLEKDLTAPPVVEVIDGTHQKFNGNIYLKSKNSHYLKQCSLHREVYAYWYGEIPEGYEIHHRDLTPSNNTAENLQALTKIEHKKIHWQRIAPREFICEVCGKKFLSKAFAYQSSRFCSNACIKKYQRKKRGTNKVCEFCGSEFYALSQNTKCCSRSCTVKLSHQDMPILRKKCPVCESPFTTKFVKQIYCSKTCKQKVKALRQRKKRAEQKSSK